MNFVLALRAPGCSGPTQLFGPYATREAYAAALEELNQWSGLHGEWEVWTLTAYEPADATKGTVPPSQPPVYPLYPLYPSNPWTWGYPGGVYCDASGRHGVAPVPNITYTTNFTSPPAASTAPDAAPQPEPRLDPYTYTFNLGEPAAPSDTAGPDDEPAVPADETAEPAAPTRPEDANPNVYRVHPPEGRTWPGKAFEVAAAYHAADPEFVHFFDNAGATILAVSRAEVGRIERLRTHTLLTTSVEELETIITALAYYGSSTFNRDKSRQAVACAERLDAVRDEARQRAEGDMSIPRGTQA